MVLGCSLLKSAFFEMVFHFSRFYSCLQRHGESVSTSPLNADTKKQKAKRKQANPNVTPNAPSLQCWQASLSIPKQSVEAIIRSYPFIDQSIIQPPTLNMNLSVVSRNRATFTCSSRPSSLPLRESRRAEAGSSNANDIGLFASPRERGPPRIRREAPRLTQRLAASRSPPLSSNSVQPSVGNLHVGLQPKKSVSFSSIDIREYERTIGTHMDIDGLPLTSDWVYDERDSIAVDDYENARSPRKPVEDLLLSANERRLILMRDCGMSTELLNAVEQRLIMKRRLDMLRSSSERRRALGGCLDGRPHLLKYI